MSDSDDAYDRGYADGWESGYEDGKDSLYDELQAARSALKVVSDVLTEALNHIDGITGASTRPLSDSGDIYAQGIKALTTHAEQKEER